MNSLKAVVVDDEPMARSRLCRLLAKQGVDVVGECENGAEAIEHAKRGIADIIFLDINMPVLNGLEAANEIGKIENSPAIVFCTAYDEYALEAFKTRANAYLLKPISESDLQQALDKVRAFSSVQLSALLDQFNEVASLVVNYFGELQKVPLGNFASFQSLDKHIFATMLDGREIVVEYTLKELEKMFPDQMLRVHRGVLINRASLSKLLKEDSGASFVELMDERRFQVSRRHLAEVKKCFA